MIYANFGSVSHKSLVSVDVITRMHCTVKAVFIFKLFVKMDSTYSQSPSISRPDAGLLAYGRNSLRFVNWWLLVDWGRLEIENYDCKRIAIDSTSIPMETSYRQEVVQSVHEQALVRPELSGCLKRLVHWPSGGASASLSLLLWDKSVRSRSRMRVLQDVRSTPSVSTFRIWISKCGSGLAGYISIRKRPCNTATTPVLPVGGIWMETDCIPFFFSAGSQGSNLLGFASALSFLDWWVSRGCCSPPRRRGGRQTASRPRRRRPVLSSPQTVAAAARRRWSAAAVGQVSGSCPLQVRRRRWRVARKSGVHDEAVEVGIRAWHPSRTGVGDDSKAGGDDAGGGVAKTPAGGWGCLTEWDSRRVRAEGNRAPPGRNRRAGHALPEGDACAGGGLTVEGAAAAATAENGARRSSLNDAARSLRVGGGAGSCGGGGSLNSDAAIVPPP